MFVCSRARVAKSSSMHAWISGTRHYFKGNNMDGSLKALVIGGVVFTALLVAIGIGINLGQSGPAAAGAAPRQSLADMQREQMQMARDAMHQASKMQQMHQQHMRMMEAEMMGEYGAYDDYATGRDPFSDVDFSDWE